MPPTAVILSDPTHTDYTKWDYKLLKAYYLKQEFMSGNFPVWIDRSPRVEFEVKSFKSKSAAALERKQAAEAKKEGNTDYGRQFYAVPITIDGGPMPTLRDYLEEEAKNKGNKQPSGPPRG